MPRNGKVSSVAAISSDIVLQVEIGLYTMSRPSTSSSIYVVAIYLWYSLAGLNELRRYNYIAVSINLRGAC
jgi:hypothetical protein